jgi:SPP1 gp7 family putative phage head morphogenesis protein
VAYTRETQRLVDEMRRDARRITDASARRLVEAWVRAWDDLSIEFDAAIADLLTIRPGHWPSRAQIRRSTVARRALDLAQARLEQLAETARVSIIIDALDAIDAGAGAQAGIVDSQLPPSVTVGIAFDRLPQDAIDAIVQRVTEQITSLTRPLAAAATDAMRSALIRGVVVGENPRTTAAEMLRRTQGAFNGGLTRALTISRTEILDAHRAGAQAQREANADVLSGWKWLCELSSRTCPACLAMNGTVHKAGEPGPSGHPNCRCAAVPITKSWRDLGIDLDEPADVFPDAQAWFNDQPTAVQNRIMGPSRLAALRSGAASWEQLATKHTNPGWRPSYQATAVRSLVRAG